VRRVGRLVQNLAQPDRAGIGNRLDLVSDKLGRQEIQALREGPQLPHLRDYGVRVFSQFDEDGIIGHLLHEIPQTPKTFVEFGVADYRESNTRFLVRQADWRGVIIEADPVCCEHIRRLEESWRYDLRLVEAFITRENINKLIADAGFEGDIGVLSIDIDGNDYWVWKALDVVTPMITVIEFNGRFGPDRAVSIPYDPTFTRMAASHTGIYYGASLAAMIKLANEKGYDYVGSNSADINAFFVRSEHRPTTLSALTAAKGFRPLRLREMRNASGDLTFDGPETEAAVLSQLPLVEV
jgi:hypothetical protein